MAYLPLRLDLPFVVPKAVCQLPDHLFGLRKIGPGTFEERKPSGGRGVKATTESHFGDDAMPRVGFSNSANYALA